MYGGRHLINMEERIFWRGNPAYVMKGIHLMRGNPKGIHQRGLSRNIVDYRLIVLSVNNATYTFLIL